MTADRHQPSPEEYRSAAALRAGLRQFSKASERVLHEHGLTTERFELLLAIRAAGDGGHATVSDLCAALGTAQSSVTQLVRRAEDAGLLRREVSSTDARVRHLRLTEQGETQLGGAVTDLREERARLGDIISRL
jgi:DNA-binding MarR family transcriptional regulator